MDALAHSPKDDEVELPAQSTEALKLEKLAEILTMIGQVWIGIGCYALWSIRMGLICRWLFPQQVLVERHVREKAEDTSETTMRFVTPMATCW